MDVWIALFILAVLIAIFSYCCKDLNHFKKHGIIHIPPLPLVGNMGSFFLRRLSMAALVERIYKLNLDAKYVGFFDGMNPVLVIRDPELIKSIAVKHFDVFPNHRSIIDEVDNPFHGKNLFSLRDEKWRDLMTLLSPAFTSSKMKTMFKLMSDCAAEFAEFLSKLPADKSVMDMKDSFAKYTNDVIATCVFGISLDSMRNPKNDFYVYGKETTSFDLARTVKFYFVREAPLLAKMLGIKIINEPAALFFKDLVRSTIHIRDTKNIVRPDILQLMMESRGKRGTRELTIEDMTSQAFIFFFGGFNTTSNLMCFVAHKIATKPDVQEKLRNEVDEVLRSTNGNLTYEALNGMEYLDATINEALRMYPMVPFLDRICAKDFELPPALPGDKPFVVKEGESVWFPIYSLHRDPQYFPEPDEFSPERFLKKNVSPAAFIPFGIGPRICIGNGFALLETKAVLFHLLARCELKKYSKSTHPIRFSSSSFVMQAEGRFWLRIEPRSDSQLHVLSGTSLTSDD